MSRIAVYYTSWNATWVSKKEDLDLYNLKKKYPSVNCVYISFAKQDLIYRRGQNSWDGTGLQFSMDFNIVKDSIKYLKSLGVVVLIAFGGGSYWSYNTVFNEIGVANLVYDLDADGAELDYEISGNGALLTDAVFKLRPLIPGRLISIAGFSTGAYEPNGIYSGMNIDCLTKCGHLINWVNLMAYDAGPPDSYNPIEALKAYRKIYKGPILMGFLIGQPGWGGYLLTSADVARNASFAASENIKNGAFIWADKKTGPPTDIEVVAQIASIFKVQSAPVIPAGPVKVEELKIKCPVCMTTFTK
jgi:hypothetical protein